MATTPTKDNAGKEASIKDFESAIAELEKIVKQLEDGDLALDKSLALFERGVELSLLSRAARRGPAPHRSADRAR